MTSAISTITVIPYQTRVMSIIRVTLTFKTPEQTRVMSIIGVTLTSHPFQRTRVMSIIGGHPISNC